MSGEATVPATVTIAANQAVATFTVTGVEDGVADGDQTIELAASASGFSRASAALTVIDRSDISAPVLPDVAQLSVSAQVSTAEVSWNPATDDGALAYTLTVTDGVSGQSQTLATTDTQLSVGDLLPLRPHSFNLVVADGAGNSVVYETAEASTGAAVDEDGDGLGDNLQAADGSAEDADGDGVSDDIEGFLNQDVSQKSDTNGNGIPDVVELAQGIDVRNVALSATGFAGATRPSIDGVDAIGVISRGLFTPVSTAVSAADGPAPSAYLRRGRCADDILPANYRDACQRVPLSDADERPLLRPGRNKIWWLSVDANGNWPAGGAVVQTIDIVPRISLNSGVQQTGQGVAAPLLAVLNGLPVDAASELNVPYSVRDLQGNVLFQGSWQFAAGELRAQSEIAGAHLMQDVEVTMDTDDRVFVADAAAIDLSVMRVTPGEVTSQSISLVESNLAPLAALRFEDADDDTRTSFVVNTPVTVVVTARDANGDALRYDWSATTSLVAPSDAATTRFSYTPTATGVFVVVVGVSDGLATTTVRSSFRVIASDPSASAPAGQDSDADGLDDVAERLADGDRDGVPNYLERDEDNAAVLPIDSAELRLISTQPGLSLRLGYAALASAQLGMRDRQGFNAALVAAVLPLDDMPRTSEIFDFEVHDLPILGAQVQVVIPLAAEIPNDPQYRKYFATALADFVGRQGWVDFDTTTASATGVVDGLASTTQLAAGICPDASDPSWSQSGLAPGTTCLRLSIRDGGPNDADGRVNGAIADPGALGEALNRASDSGEEEGFILASSGGGGVGSAFISLLLSLLAWRYRRRVRRHPGTTRRRASAALGLLVLGLAPTEFLGASEVLVPGWYVGHGLSYSELNPDTQNSIYRVSESRDSGAQFLLGYRFLPAWQAEFSYAQLGQTTLSFASGSNAGSVVGDVSYTETTLGLLWVPWARQERLKFSLEPLLQAGLRAADHDNDFNADLRVGDRYQGFYGIGVEARWSSGFAVRLSYVDYSDDAESIQLSLIGYIGPWQ